MPIQKARRLMHLGEDVAHGFDDPHCMARTVMPVTAQMPTTPAVAHVMRLWSRDTDSRSRRRSIDILARQSDAMKNISEAYCAYVFLSALGLLAKRTTNLLNVHYLCVAEYIFLLPQAIVDTSQHCNGLANT
jgi:hypothetical protein